MKDFTPYFIIITLFVIVLYDIYTFRTKGVKTTISRWVLGWSQMSVALILLIGFLLGHLLWGQPLPCE